MFVFELYFSFKRQKLQNICLLRIKDVNSENGIKNTNPPEQLVSFIRQIKNIKDILPKYVAK